MQIRPRVASDKIVKYNNKLFVGKMPTYTGKNFWVLLAPGGWKYAKSGKSVMPSGAVTSKGNT